MRFLGQQSNYLLCPILAKLKKICNNILRENTKSNFFFPTLCSRHRFSDPFCSILEIKLDRSNIRHGWTVVTGLRSRFLFYPTFEIPLSLTLFSSLASKALLKICKSSSERLQIGNTGPDGSGSATPCRAIVE